jgi:hypothetical protein
MTTFIDAFPDVHHHIEKLVTDGENGCLRAETRSVIRGRTTHVKDEYSAASESGQVRLLPAASAGARVAAGSSARSPLPERCERGQLRALATRRGCPQGFKASRCEAEDQRFPSRRSRGV